MTTPKQKDSGESKTSTTPTAQPDRKDLHEFAERVCCGNRYALEFCDNVMIYFHLIDDLWDTREDGKPAMNSEEFIRVFSYALLVYNSKFYIQHQQHLFPIFTHVTNAFADVLLFEKAPEAHKRAIADVIRCCGNDVFFIVALICGGYQHMRSVSPLIRERSWIIQHTEEETRI